MEKRIVTNAEDVAYVRSHFRQARTPDASLPAASYYDSEGNAYVPDTYENQERDRARFVQRAAAEMTRLKASYDDDWLAEAWEAYWDGIYGMCLKDPTPENIVRKNWLIGQISALLATPRESDPAWLDALNKRVDELDELELPFCAFDRAYFGRPVSRDVYVSAVRERYFAATL
ncbi:MAG TPA: DUF6058 family natural product biosynthesis protein [Candidatus Baltobacteraceae bacterium]|jgi:hypothetical protein|nr:DUF6058 family natural product biosynthesis protein [Candidatus Baltobacteraceae bacterium]